MANGQDAVLDEINQLGKRGGTAVAEPEDDPVLSEIKGLGAKSRPTFSRPNDEYTPPPPKLIENIRAIAPTQQETAEAARLAKQPKMAPLTERAARVGQGPQFTPPKFPMPPPAQAAPTIAGQHAGLAGPATGISAAPTGVAAYLDNLNARLHAAVSPTRFDKSGKPLPNPLDILPSTAPLPGLLNVGAGLAKTFGTETGPMDPVTAARFGEPRAAEPTMAPDVAARNREEAIGGFNQATGGAFQALAPLGLLAPVGSAGEMYAGFPLYGAAADAGQKALTKAGMKPQTAEAVTNMALAFGPAIFHAARIEAPEDPIRDMAVGIGHEATTRAMADYPNFANMTDQAQAAILNEKEVQVWTDLVNASKVEKAKFAKKMGIDPATLYDYVNQPEQEKPAAPPQIAPSEAAEAPEKPAPEPEPETPPAPAAPAKQAPIDEVLAEIRGLEAKTRPPQEPPTAEAPETPLRESQGEAPGEEVPERYVRQPEPPAAGRAKGPLPEMAPAEKADLEEQAGRPLTNEEAQAYRVSQVSRGAVAAQAQEREQGPPRDVIAETRAQTPPIEAPTEPKANISFSEGLRAPVGPPSEETAPPQIDKYAKRQAQLYINRIKNPLKREYAQAHLAALTKGEGEPQRPEGLSGMAAQAVRSNLRDYLKMKEPASPEETFSPDTLAEAKNELTSAHALWSELPAPGRFEAVSGEPGRERGAGWYGINSPRPKVEELYPWLKDSKIGIAELGRTLARGKGAAYDRILSRAAAHIDAQREEAAPILAEYSDQLRGLSAQVREIDPQLASTLDELADGKYTGVRNLRTYVQDKIADAESAATFNAAIDSLAKSETGDSVPEELAERPEPRSETREESSVLPGLEKAVAEQKESAATLQGERLTEEINKPPESIEEAAGEMERKSPLFRGTEASPQRELLPPRTAEKPTSQKKKKSKAPSYEALLEEAYKPGNVVKSYYGYDKVLGFRKADPSKPYPEDQWRVDVIASDKDGNPLPGERPRAHHTAPEKSNLAAARKRLEAATVQPVGERQSPLEGPGTPAAGQFDPTESDLEQLTDAIGKTAKASDSPAQKIRHALNLTRPFTRIKSSAMGAVANIKAVAAAVNDFYRRPPEWTDYKNIKGEYTLALQRAAHELNNFTTKMKREFPIVVRREGMAAYVEAGGNEDTLRKWAREAKDKSAYNAALDLTDEEKTTARNIHQFQEQRADYAIKQGIMEHAVENYVMHVWEKANKFTRGIVNVIRTKMLQPNPSFAKKRIFPTFFEGEQAGYKAKTKDIAELAAAHEYALNEAVAARAFIKSMLSGKAEDGRPLAAVSGSGHAVQEPGEEEKAYFINPNTKPEDIADYRSVDHPALRAWKWATQDGEGNPVFVKGDLVVHPDAYKDLKNILGHSALRSWNIPGTEVAPFNTALKLSTEFKNTLLSLSMFHQTQETLHGLEHRVNPTKLVDINFGDQKQSGLVKHGLQVATFHGKEAFSEGVSGSGLINRLPGIGPYLQDYQNYLFGSYIPRMKMTMGLDALERNMKRYKGDLTEDQIYELTARQSNAAFGEQNYVMMGRNKTLQDVLRMGLLAPDFLESRARFVGQAVRPYGREQLTALLLGAAVMYIGARLLNQLLSGDPHMAPQDAFNVEVKGHSYGLRTIQGDILHLATDPRGFAFSRLNPVYGRGSIEAITGRDEYGRKRTPGEQISDLVKGIVPISFQGLMKTKPATLADTALSAAGVTTTPYTSPADKLAQQFTRDSVPEADESPEEEAAGRRASELIGNIRLGKEKPDALQTALTKGEITKKQFDRATKELHETPLETDVQRMTVEQALQVWDKANEQERADIAPLLIFKASSLDNRTPAERAKILPKLDAILGQYTGLKASGLSPTKAGDVDDVEAELSRLEAHGMRAPTLAESDVPLGKLHVPLSVTERADYQRLRGNLSRQVLTRMFASSEYKKLTDNEKMDEIDEANRQVNEFARDQMTARVVNKRLGRTETSAVPVGPPQ